MRAGLVVNLQSRRGRALAADVRAALDARGVEVVDLRDDDDPGWKNGIECIVGVGGDGTLLRLVGKALQLKIPLGVVPTGTFNELARTLEIPLEVDAACDAIAGGRTRAIDVARVNGVYYINEASIGISSRIARIQAPEQKQRFGFLAIVWTSLQAFWYARPMHLHVSYENNTERFKSIQLTIANSHRFGGLFMVSDAAIDDGWLDLYSVDIHNVFEAFSVARVMFSGRRQSAPGLRTYRARQFAVRSRYPHRITADGEPAGRTPATFEVLPKALNVFVRSDHAVSESRS